MAIFQDSCTDTDGVQWQSHTPETGSITRLWGSNATVDVIITSNQVSPESDGDDGTIYTFNGTYPSADYKITATRVAIGTAVRPTYLLLRVQDQENMYAVRFASNGASDAQLYKKVSGTWSTIGAAFSAPAAGSVVEFEIIGSTLKVRDDSTQIASETDTAISAAGKAGFAAGGGAELVTALDDSHNNNIWDTFLVENLGSGAFTLTAAQGSFSLIGQTAGLLAGRLLTAVQGNYILSGQIANLNRGFILAANQGSYTLSGQVAGLIAARLLTAIQGSYSLIGQTAGLNRGFILIATQGSYTLTGQDAGLVYAPGGGAFTLVAAQGSYVLTGQAANLRATRLITAIQGSYTLTGQSANLRAGRVLTAIQGAYVLSGQSASLLIARLILANQGSYTLSGQSAVLNHGFRLIAAQGSYTLSGQVVLFTLIRVLLAGQGSYVLSGQAATLTYSAMGGLLTVDPDNVIYVFLRNRYVTEVVRNRRVFKE